MDSSNANTNKNSDKPFTPDDEPISIDDNPIEIEPPQKIPADEAEKPIPFAGDLISFDSDKTKTEISHSPLHFGSDTAGTTKPEQKAGKIVSEKRITGVKTFFTKLHAGSIQFLDGQISQWLKSNPDVIVKHISIATGNVISKKTEPNLIITIWY